MQKSQLFLDLSQASCREEKKDSLSMSLSCQIGTGGIKIPSVDLQVQPAGTKLMTTGQYLGYIDPKDLIYEQRLGQGASGHVQKAIHSKYNVPLAIKMIGVYEKEKRHQLVNQLKTLIKNQCPFLINCYGAYYEDGKVHVILQYMDSGSIGQIVRILLKTLPENQDYVLPQIVMSKIAHQILQGLQNLHHVRYQVHRDIKPDNILLNSNGQVKLTDFGISKQLQQTVGQCNTFIGTSAYMSPQRISTVDYSYPSDIWSLGVVLIQLAIGKYPYSRKTGSYIELYQRIQEEQPPTIDDHQFYSEEFKHFINCCLRKNQTDRATARELLMHPWILSYKEWDQDLVKWITKLNSAKAILRKQQRKKREQMNWASIGLAKYQGLNQDTGIDD